MYKTYPNLIERFQHVVFLQVNQKDLKVNTATIKLQGSKTINPPTAGDMVSVLKGQDYFSPTLRKNRINRVEETRKGKMNLQIDPDDFSSSTFHGEGAFNFVRLQELDSTGTVLKTGGWLVVPTSQHINSSIKLITLSGQAPSVSTPITYSGLAPVGSLELLFPRKVGRIDVTNSGANPLYIALDSSMQEVVVAAGSTMSFRDTGASALFLRATGGTTTFNLNCVLSNGLDL